MKQPKIKNGPSAPKQPTKANVLPREAQNLFMRKYQAAQRKNHVEGSPNATEYAQQEIDGAVGEAGQVVSQLARVGLDLAESRSVKQVGSAGPGVADSPRPGVTASPEVDLLRKKEFGGAARQEWQGAASMLMPPGAGQDLQTAHYIPAPTARQAGRELQAAHHMSAVAAKAARQELQAEPNKPAAKAKPEWPELQTAQYIPAPTAQQAGRELQAGRYQSARKRTESSSANTLLSATNKKTGRPNAIKSGGAAIRAVFLAVKTTAKAASSKEQQEQKTQQARQAAQKSARVIWQRKAAKSAAKGIQQTFKAVVRSLSVAAKALIPIAGMGGAAAIVVCILIGGIAYVIASPFGILYSVNESGPEVQTLAQIVRETNSELLSLIEQIKLDYSYVDEIKVTFDGSESNTAINNWADVAAVFAVKTTLADGDSSTDVVRLDAEKAARLKAVFWDMTPIETSVAEETRTRTVMDSAGNETSEEYTYYILNIIVDSLNYREGAALYSFTADENAVLEEMMQPENYLLLLALTGTENTGQGLSPAELAAIMAQLDGLNLDQQAFVTAALSLVGRVNYFWGGKSTAIGWDNRWGTPAEVTAAGSRSTGSTRPFGLDCSGYVAWCYAQLGVSPDIIGWGVTGQWNTSTAINWQDAQPGDLAIFAIPGTIKTNHIGIVVGFNAEGKPLVAHCSSGRNNVTIGEAEATGFRYVRRPLIFGE